MLRATSTRKAGEFSDIPCGSVVLDSSDRHLRRKLITTSQGDKVMVDLPEPVLFADGDLLVLEDGRAIEIIAAKEKLYEVRQGADMPLLHLSWHLGNRHFPAQIDEDRILIRRDHVIRAMLEGLGATVTDTIERFQPVHGAYHGHAQHDHSDEHHASHPPSRSQGRAHDRDQRDKYGRLPGDPHYGHNHD